MKNKKAQIQMGETIAIIVIVIVMIFLGVIFYNKIQSSSYAEKSNQYKELTAIEASKIASSLPELQCSRTEFTESSCFDIMKIEAFAATVDKETRLNYYYYIFRNANITIEQIYPSQNKWNVYYSEANATAKQVLTVKSVRMPVSLYNPIDDSYGFGVLIVESQFG